VPAHRDQQQQLDPRSIAPIAGAEGPIRSRDVAVSLTPLRFGRRGSSVPSRSREQGRKRSGNRRPRLPSGGGAEEVVSKR